MSSAQPTVSETRVDVTRATHKPRAFGEVGLSRKGIAMREILSQRMAHPPGELATPLEVSVAGTDDKLVQVFGRAKLCPRATIGVAVMVHNHLEMEPSTR